MLVEVGQRSLDRPLARVALEGLGLIRRREVLRRRRRPPLEDRDHAFRSTQLEVERPKAPRAHKPVKLTLARSDLIRLR
jgi:hypothetical protein